MFEYDWPDAQHRSLIGKRISRLDGPAKVTGAAKYSYDIRRPGMLYAKQLYCPHAHVRITRLDVSPAEAMPGVKAVHVIQPQGTEIQWALDEIVAVAAVSEEIAEDAVRAIVVEYEVLPHQVNDRTLDGAAGVRPGQEETAGEPGLALRDAAARVKGIYGQPVIAHNCLEPHGQISEWDGENLTSYASTQAVSAVASQLSEGLKIPATNVRVITQYMGGGFGSKFSADRWGIVGAELARKAGAPVKLMLDRAPELTIAGDRPSAYAEIEVGAAADGTITGWKSRSWGSGGLGGAGNPPLPYVFQIPNRQHVHASIPTNTASSRAWRAPNHPQGCFLTMSALEDLAAELKMNPLDFFLKNLPLTNLAKMYAEEFAIADRLMDWRKRWHRRGDGGKGPVKQGLGLSLHTWGGRGHRSSCDVTIHPDGMVDAKISSQDIGTGTRTVIAIVVAETLGLPLDQVRVNLGDSTYPTSGGSGGSTTVGGVSAAARRAAVHALQQLFEKIAPLLETTPDKLAARRGEIGDWGGHELRSFTWKEAARQLATPITANGANPGPGELTNSGAGGVQMANVSVDVETGVVRINKLVAVQDCGLVIDMKTAKSQVYGALIMGVSYALSEEKVIDPVSGRMLNVDFESYKLAGIGDVGELVVHMMTGPGYDERGVIGLGEPPVISPGAAIANAVANAIGVRVPYLPLTPQRVLDALEANNAGEDRLMQPFEYANPTTKEQAARLLAGEHSTVLAGGSDLLALMKDRVETPARLVNLKSVAELHGIRWDAKTGLRIGALTTIDELAADASAQREHPILAKAADHVAGPQIRHVATIGGNLCQRPRCWYFRNGFGLLAQQNGKSMVVDGDNRYHAILGNDGPAEFVQPSTLAPLLIALGARLDLFGPQGSRQIDLERFYRVPAREGEREHDLQPGEIVAWMTVPPVAGRKVSSYEVRQRQTLDWSLATAAVALEMDGQKVREARLILGQVAPVPWVTREAQDFLRGKTIDEAVAEKAGEAAVTGAKALSGNRYKIQLTRTAVKRALLAAARGEA